MVFQITPQEAVQIQVNDKKVIRRAWYKCNYEAGSKIPVFLKPKGGSIFVLDVIGMKEETVSQMTDAKAKEEGFKNLSDWRSHWEKLYNKDGRCNGGTRIFALRFRKGDMTHHRIRVIDGPQFGDPTL
jgi:hypothetical protein